VNAFFPDEGDKTMKNPFISGEKVYLRRLEQDDLVGDYFQWLNDFEVTKFLETGHFPNSHESMESYFAQHSSAGNEVFLAVCLCDNDRHIGNVKLGSINWIHRRAEFGIVIGAKDCWNKGYGTEATVLLIDYAFRRLNLHKVMLGVVETNHAAIKIYEKIGFKVEGRLREQLYVDGRYRDNILMGALPQEFYEKNPSFVS
jgi:[ribosomal protein S5]-alanine N-acetyltransferase